MLSIRISLITTKGRDKKGKKQPLPPEINKSEKFFRFRFFRHENKQRKKKFFLALKTLFLPEGNMSDKGRCKHEFEVAQKDKNLSSTCELCGGSFWKLFGSRMMCCKSKIKPNQKYVTNFFSHCYSLFLKNVNT